MMNHSPSQDGSAGDLVFAGRQLSLSLTMKPLSEPWPMASFQEGPSLRLRFDTADSWSGPSTSPVRLDWTGSRPLLPGSDLHLSAAFGGLMAGGVTKSHGEELPLLGTNPMVVGNTPGEAWLKLVVPLGVGLALPDAILGQATEQAAQDAGLSDPFRPLAEPPWITLPQISATLDERLADTAGSLAKLLRNEIPEEFFIMHSSNTGSADAIWNA